MLVIGWWTILWTQHTDMGFLFLGLSWTVLFVQCTPFVLLVLFNLDVPFIKSRCV